MTTHVCGPSSGRLLAGVVCLLTLPLNHDCSVSLNNCPRPTTKTENLEGGDNRMQRYGAFTAAHTQLAEEDYPETLAATLSSRHKAVDICASRQRFHSRYSLAPRGVAASENWSL
jgi:hypothetical protein